MKDKFHIYQLDLLQKEIDEIQNKISNYDDISFKIKGWAVIIWSGIVLLGAREQSYEIGLISIVAILGFWILDTHFKIYQRRSMFRMGVIEDFLNSRNKFRNNGLKESFKKGEIDDFPIHDPIGGATKHLNKCYNDKYESKTNFWWCFNLNNVRLVYLALILGSLILSILIRIRLQ